MAAIYSLVSAATANLTSVSATPTTLRGWTIRNTSAATKYVRFYNKATAPISTDVPVLRLPIPAAGISEPENVMAYFGLGLAFDITGAAPDNDATATAAGDVTLNLFYDIP